jgi:hypothetical protein
MEWGIGPGRKLAVTPAGLAVSAVDHDGERVVGPALMSMRDMEDSVRVNLGPRKLDTLIESAAVIVVGSVVAKRRYERVSRRAGLVEAPARTKAEAEEEYLAGRGPLESYVDATIDVETVQKGSIDRSVLIRLDDPYSKHLLGLRQRNTQWVEVGDRFVLFLRRDGDRWALARDCSSSMYRIMENGELERLRIAVGDLAKRVHK